MTKIWFEHGTIITKHGLEKNELIAKETKFSFNDTVRIIPKSKTMS